jgi:hypothetical protein
VGVVKKNISIQALIRLHFDCTPDRDQFVEDHKNRVPPFEEWGTHTAIARPEGNITGNYHMSPSKLLEHKVNLISIALEVSI